MTNIIETDVLIIGAGPAGIVASILLADLGVRNLTISKYPSTSPSPRAHITNQRTMEIFRDIGIEAEAAAVGVPQDYMGEHVYATSLAGEEFGRIPGWGTHPSELAEHTLASPTSVCDLPQLYLEPLLVSQAALRGSDIRFQTEYIGHEQDSEGVTTALRDRLTGAEYAVRSKYLIGADGGRSKVAEDIKLPFEGQMAMGDSGSINIEFTADLSSLCEHRRGVMYWMLQAGTGANGTGVGVLRMIRPWNKWVAIWGYELAQGAPKLSEEEALRVVHKLIGDDTVPVKIGAMSSWTINQQHAAELSRGRVFCMGDAVHRHPPMGGLGLNTSVQDAYNLAWKLALVLKGQAGERLLDSYNVERAPVARQIVERAFASVGTFPPLFQALGIPPMPTEEDLVRGMTRLKTPDSAGAQARNALRLAMDNTRIGFGSGHGVEMNQRYVSDAIVPDGSRDSGYRRDPDYFFEASTRPGAHLPHVWLTSNQRRVSTLDLCGKGSFTLLTGLSGGAWTAAAADTAALTGVDIRVHIIGMGQEYADTFGDFARISEIAEDGALLVRPDMMVAWRAPNASVPHLQQLTPAMKTVLAQ